MTDEEIGKLLAEATPSTNYLDDDRAALARAEARLRSAGYTRTTAAEVLRRGEEIERLRAEVARLTAERDDARKIVGEIVAAEDAHCAQDSHASADEVARCWDAARDKIAAWAEED